MSSLVDAHCHIDLYESPQELINKIESQKIYTIAVTNAPSVYHYTHKLVSCTKYLRAAIGLHPQLVKSRKHELSAMWKYLESTRYVGEIGLDYGVKDEEDHRSQREIFHQILEQCARYSDKVLTVHSRHAAPDVISTIGDKFPGKVILHWYSGKIRDLERAINYGMYFSVNHTMISTKKGRALIERMPKERVITETDGPFAKFQGKICEPMDVKNAVTRLSEIWKVDPDYAKEIVYRNFRSMLE